MSSTTGRLAAGRRRKPLGRDERQHWHGAVGGCSLGKPAGLALCNGDKGRREVAKAGQLRRRQRWRVLGGRWLQRANCPFAILPASRAHTKRTVKLQPDVPPARDGPVRVTIEFAAHSVRLGSPLWVRNLVERII